LGKLTDKIFQFVLFIKYYWGDKMKEDWMGGVYIMHWSDEKCMKNFSRET